MTDFVILYEIEPRELESIVILGNELKCRGYTVEYYSIKEFTPYKYISNRRALKRFRNQTKVLLVPSCYHNKELMDYYYGLFGKVEKIVDLRWEQYFRNYVMDDPNSSSFIFPNEGAKNAYHVCWGDISLQSMLDVGISKERLLKTGPIHMDILREEFRSYYINKEQLLQKYNLDSKKRTVLFISSYTNATDKTAYFRFLNNFFSGNYSVDYEAIALEKESYALTVEWIEEFLEKNKDINFIWRPHPTEIKTDALTVLERKYPYFKVVSDYSVKQWILTCEIIVTWFSTAVIEAFFANRACFILRPVEYPYDRDLCVYKNASYIESKEEFLNIVTRNCKNTLDCKYIYQCYDVDESVPSYVRLADRLEKIYHSREMFPWDEEVIRKFNRSDRLRYMRRSTFYICKAKIASVVLEVSKVIHLSFSKKINKKLMKHANNYKQEHTKKDNPITMIDAALAPKVRKAYEIRYNNQTKKNNAKLSV